MSRPLTVRERAVLDALLSVDLDGVDALRRQAARARVVGGCRCGCPSIDFHHAPGVGMRVRVDATTRTADGLFLYTLGDRLGGIEWVGTSDEGVPAELPDPTTLTISPA